MLSALLYLRFTSAKNWLLSRLRRLRQPKFLIGAIVGGAYFYFFFFRPLGGSGMRRAAGRQALDAAGNVLPADLLPASTAFGAMALLLFFALMWIVPTGPASLGFSEAEIAFLFPAPVTRRALVHFRLLSAQFRSLIFAVFMMLFSNRWHALGGSAFTHAIGWWFIFSALNLHHSGAGFVLTRLAERGVGTWWRRTLALLALAAVFGVTLALLPPAQRLPAFTGNFDLRPISIWLIALGSAPPLGWVLWPMKLLVAPFLAPDWGGFLIALAPALAVLVLHYLWVVRTAVRFEDAALDHAAKRTARIAAWRAGNRRFGRAPTKGRAAPFALAGFGRPELAFLWKNLLSTWPYFSLRVFAIAAFVIAAGCTWLNSQPFTRGLREALVIAPAFFCLYALVVGPQFARQDIRLDLQNMDILKTYPLRGWQIMLGELLTPIAILTGLLWLALLTIALLFHPARDSLAWLTLDVRVALTFALAVIVPLIVALQLLVPNAAALLFPDFFHAMRGRGGGPEVVGQRMIFFFAQMMTMIAALLPAAGVGAAIGGLLVFVLHLWPALAIVVSAVAVFAVLVLEVWGGLCWLGARFERLDVSVELRS